MEEKLDENLIYNRIQKGMKENLNLLFSLFLFSFLISPYRSFGQNIFPVNLKTASSIGNNPSDISRNLYLTSDVVKIYPYYVEPTEYPDFSRRPFMTPTWKTFNDMVQFVGGRSWGKTFGFIDGNAPDWIAGAKVMRPNFVHFMMDKDSLRKSLLRLKNGGYYLFNINAYGPGTPLSGGFGQFKVEKWKTQMMEDILQDRYMGFDLGEQDGRYWADCRSIDFPMSPNYTERYLNAMKYMQRAAVDQGDIISLLSVKWFWHYPIKDGFITIAGAETQNKTFTSSGQVQYAFIRGASKQYGLLWYGDISVFNSWGWKTYGTENDPNTSPNKGNSVSWMKRMLLTQYQYNASILGFEGSKFHEKQKNEAKLSPIGQLQTDMQNFVRKYPKPGPQHTPVAFLLDFFSGWMTPSDPFPDKYKVWNYLPYKKGDFLTHELLKIFYQDYDQNGLNKNEYGGLSNTPYGDALDILLSDTRATTLSRYQVVVVAGELKTNLHEVSDKLNDYTKQGGHLVITIENAQKLFPGLNLIKPFEYEEIKNGKGRITIIHCREMGIEQDNKLNDKVKSYLDGIFKTTRIFSVGDSLGYVTNIEGEGKFMLGIFNNSLKSRSFEIKSHIGKINRITELNPIRNLTNGPGYYPEGYGNTQPGLSDEKNIASGDSRIFLVEVKEDRVHYLTKATPEKRVINNYLALPSLIGTPEFLQSMPTFFDYFSGIKLNWKRICEIDSLKFKEDSWWYNLKQLQFAVEFDQDFASAYKTNNRIIDQIAAKLAFLNKVDLLVFPKDFDGRIAEKLAGCFSSKPQTSFKNSDRLFVAEDGEADFSKTMDAPVIIDHFYHTWDDIYPVAKAMSTAAKYKFNSKVGLIKITGDTNFKVKSENSNLYFSLHDFTKDIPTILNMSPEYMDHFGGIKIDGTYLLSRSEEKCLEEAEVIKKTGLKIIVDLCREINNYPNLTWLSEIEHSYERSKLVQQNILKKMELMGIKQVIISSHMRPEQWRPDIKRSQEESIISGISEFVKKANDSGITVSIQNAMYKHYPSRLLAKPDEVIRLVTDLKKKYGNVKLAANLGFGDDPFILTAGSRDNLNICIVAAEGSNLFDYRVPFSKSGNIVKFEIDKNVMVVFDADYKNVNELIDEKNFIQSGIIQYY